MCVYVRERERAKERGEDVSFHCFELCVHAYVNVFFSLNVLFFPAHVCMNKYVCVRQICMCKCQEVEESLDPQMVEINLCCDWL